MNGEIIMKKEKMRSTLFYIAAFLFYIASIIDFITKTNHSMSIVWLCLGSSFLCLATIKSKKNKDVF